MKAFNIAGNLLSKVFVPLRKNAMFFIFMYWVGGIVSYMELPDNRPSVGVYSNLWLEMFFDLYIVCLLLIFISKKIRRWIRGLLYFIVYTTTIVDLFCWEKFQSTLNPSMLLLVGETDGREVSEFFSSYITPDLLFTDIGVVLLMAVYVV